MCVWHIVGAQEKPSAPAPPVSTRELPSEPLANSKEHICCGYGDSKDFCCCVPCGSVSLRIFLGLVPFCCSLPVLLYFNTSFL